MDLLEKSGKFLHHGRKLLGNYVQWASPTWTLQLILQCATSFVFAGLVLASTAIQFVGNIECKSQSGGLTPLTDEDKISVCLQYTRYDAHSDGGANASGTTDYPWMPWVYLLLLIITFIPVLVKKYFEHALLEKFIQDFVDQKLEGEEKYISYWRDSVGTHQG